MSILKSNNVDYRTAMERFLTHISMISRSSHSNGYILTYSSGIDNTVDMFCKKLSEGCLVIYVDTHTGYMRTHKVGVVEGFTKYKVTVSFVESFIGHEGIECKKVIKHLKSTKLIRVELKEIQSLTGLKWES